MSKFPKPLRCRRTRTVMKEIDAILNTEPAIRYVSSIAGYSLLSQTTGPRNAVYFCSLQPYHERTTATLQSGPIIAAVNQKLAALPGAIAFAFPPPAIPGIGQAS